MGRLLNFSVSNWCKASLYKSAALWYNGVVVDVRLYARHETNTMSAFLKGANPMKKLLVYLRPYRLQAILAPCFKLLEAAFELLVPLIMGV